MVMHCSHIQDTGGIVPAYIYFFVSRRTQTINSFLQSMVCYTGVTDK